LFSPFWRQLKSNWREFIWFDSNSFKPTLQVFLMKKMKTARGDLGGCGQTKTRLTSLQNSIASPLNLLQNRDQPPEKSLPQDAANNDSPIHHKGTP